MKKHFIFSLSLLAFVMFAAHASAAEGFTALAPIPGLTDQSATSVVNSETLANFFNNLYKYLVGLAAIVAVVQIMWAGLDIAYFQKDAVSEIQNDKGKIYNAIFGLVLVLSPALVFSIINPSILNLSLNLPPIENKGGGVVGETTSSTGGGGAPAKNLAPTTGCSTANSGPYLEKAVCASQDDANSYSCTNGLTLQVSACKVTDPNGNCIDTSVTAYCSGKTTTLTAYQYYQSYSGILIGNPSFIPKDQAAADAFEAACQKDGGVYSASITTAGKAFIASHTYQASALTNGCSADSGVTIDKSKGGGVACYGQALSCNPPN